MRKKRDARERFYTNDIIPLLPQIRSAVILAENFNCVLSQANATGRKHYSRTLDTLVRELPLSGAWDQTTARLIFTYYIPMETSRTNRIYITENMQSKKPGIETVATTFTDHFAITLRMSLDDAVPSRKQGIGT